jgi:hypothetical protein
MRRRGAPLRRPALGTVLGGLALMVSLGGVAFATIPGSDGTINGCYNPTVGPPYPLTVVDTPAGCKSPSILLPFNQTGPAGPAGAEGPAGPQGPAGSDANQPVVYQASSRQQWTFNGTNPSPASRVFSLPVPAGSYAVTAHATVHGDPDGTASCQLEGHDASGFHDTDTGQANGGFVLAPRMQVTHNLAGGVYDVHYVPGEFFELHEWAWTNSIPLETTTTLASNGAVEVTCRANAADSDSAVDVTNVRIMAVAVSAVASYRPDAAAQAVIVAKPPVPPRYKPPTQFHQKPPPPPPIGNKRR